MSPVKEKSNQPQSSLSKVSEEDSELLALAKKINNFGLGEFGVFLIEAHLPLTTLLNTFATMGAPIVAPVVGKQKFSTWQEILSDRSKIEKLSSLIEEDLEKRRR